MQQAHPPFINALLQGASPPDRARFHDGQEATVYTQPINYTLLNNARKSHNETAAEVMSAPDNRVVHMIMFPARRGKSSKKNIIIDGCEVYDIDITATAANYITIKKRTPTIIADTQMTSSSDITATHVAIEDAQMSSTVETSDTATIEASDTAATIQMALDLVDPFVKPNMTTLPITTILKINETMMTDEDLQRLTIIKSKLNLRAFNDEYSHESLVRFFNGLNLTPPECSVLKKMRRYYEVLIHEVGDSRGGLQMFTERHLILSCALQSVDSNEQEFISDRIKRLRIE
jgi:hypothetical protein